VKVLNTTPIVVDNVHANPDLLIALTKQMLVRTNVRREKITVTKMLLAKTNKAASNVDVQMASAVMVLLVHLPMEVTNYSI
jgi:hypothetical protein